MPDNSEKPKYQDIFGDTLVELATANPRIVGITAAMLSGTSVSKMQKAFPDRTFDVGISEEHAVTFAGGLAKDGMRPFVAIYSSFLQRAVDQIIHDVALPELPVVFAIDRAGIVGEDGATHHGVFDIAYLKHVPNMHILAPRDEGMLRHCLKTAFSLNEPCAVRYPRGSGYGVDTKEIMRILPKGMGETMLPGRGVAIIAVGSRVHPALKAAMRIKDDIGWQPEVFDPVWLKPLPQEQLANLARTFKALLFVEEGVLSGGFSSSVLEFLSDNSLLDKVLIKRLGLGDNFVEHGSQHELRKLQKISASDIYEETVSLFNKL